MARTATVREQVNQFVHARPLHRFMIILENGTQLLVEHPECVAFNPALSEGDRGWDKFSVIADGMFSYCTFDGVTSVNVLDRGQVAG